jgi:hypothetical protein
VRSGINVDALAALPRALLHVFLALGPGLLLSRTNLTVNILLGEPLHRVGGRLIILRRAFLLHLVLETGHNFAPALGGLLLPDGFPGVKTMILLAPLDASSIYVDNTNSMGDWRSSVPAHSDDNLD